MSQSDPDRRWVVVAESDRGQRRSVELAPGKNLFVGASAHCGLQLDGGDVSSLQCLMMLEAGAVAIQDWASKTGTFVNGEAITVRTELSPQDEVRIADYRIRVHPQHASSSTQGESPTTSAERAVPAAPSGPAPSSPAPAVSPGMPARRVGNPPADGLAGEADAESDRQESADAEPPSDAVQFSDAHATPDAGRFSDAEPVSDAEHDADVEPLDLGEGVPGDGDWGFPSTDVPTCPAATDPFGVERESVDVDAEDVFRFDDDEFGGDQFDRETIELLRAEIDELQTALAQRDEQIDSLLAERAPESPRDDTNDLEQRSEAMLQRLQDLLDEVEGHDERVATLEELLRSSEEANQAEQEERAQLDAWVGDIERRVVQREEEWKAETDALRRQIAQTRRERDQAQQKLREAANPGEAPAALQETLDQLQRQNGQLQQDLDAAGKEISGLRQQLEQSESREEESLREERAAIARERAEVARLRHELQQQAMMENTLPPPKTQADCELADRLETLRDHLKEIHEAERREQSQLESVLGVRISRLWKRLEY